MIENRGLSPIVHNHFVVPNIKASSQLPFGFAVLGTYDMGIELPTVEGTIEFRFLIPEEWTEGIPRNLFFSSSRDGLKQIRIWRTWAGALRLDLVTPDLGRVSAEVAKPVITAGGLHHFAATWRAREVKLYLDGQPVIYRVIR
ncbi:MAG: hypothetical protein QW315_06880 [Candidatus Hadarchaeum sp.]